jgi:predicted aconitase with swiveling domain
MIVDIHHPQHGQSVSNRILVLPSSRGSSTGSYVLLELMRARLAPIGIVLSEPDGVICTGVLVGFETYGLTLPVIQISQTDLKTIESGSAGQVVSQETVGFLTIS